MFCWAMHESYFSLTSQGMTSVVWWNLASSVGKFDLVKSFRNGIWRLLKTFVSVSLVFVIWHSMKTFYDDIFEIFEQTCIVLNAKHIFNARRHIEKTNVKSRSSNFPSTLCLKVWDFDLTSHNLSPQVFLCLLPLTQLKVSNFLPKLKFLKFIFFTFSSFLFFNFFVDFSFLDIPF